jgi:hypothetical protein
MRTDTKTQESGLAKRGFLLLGLMLAIAAVVGFVIFRPTGTPPPERDSNTELAAFAVANSSASFPADINWGAMAILSQDLPSPPGWQVRYNATLALARRGSKDLPLGVLREMLDEDQQMRNFRVLLSEGKMVTDERAARQTIIDTLQAFDQWQKHKDAVAALRDNPELQRLHAAIDKLTRSGNEVVRKEAKNVQLATK